MSGNRDINIAHKNRLKKSIEEESLCVPIIVNEKYQIIDGQKPKPGSYKGRINSEPENNRTTLLNYKNA